MATYEDLRQRHVQTLVERMPAHVERLGWPAERLAGWQHDQLRAIVGHAIEASPWHRGRLAGLGADAPLAALPTMAKADVVEHFEEIVTDRRLTRAVVEDHLASLDAGDAYLFDEYHVVATGGSSGARTLVVWDWDGWADCFLSIGRRNLARSAGEQAVMASVIGDHASHMGAAITQTFSNPTITIHRVSATLPISTIVARLNDVQPNTLQGYPTMLHRLALEQDAGRLSIAPGNVLCTSETLTAETRALLEATFGDIVENGYATSESGGIATPCGNGPWMHMNDDLNIVEVEDGRILVTNLMNRVMPLIRYELDDRVLVGDVDCACGTAHRSVLDVQGRTSEIFRLADGAEVHPVMFSTAIGANRAVADYQVRQRGAVLEIDVVPAGALDAAAVIRAVEEGLAGAGGSSATKVCLRTVDEIRRHPVTGKATRFLPER